MPSYMYPELNSLPAAAAAASSPATKMKLIPGAGTTWYSYGCTPDYRLLYILRW